MTQPQIVTVEIPENTELNTKHDDIIKFGTNEEAVESVSTIINNCMRCGEEFRHPSIITQLDIHKKSDTMEPQETALICMHCFNA